MFLFFLTLRVLEGELTTSVKFWVILYNIHNFGSIPHVLLLNVKVIMIVNLFQHTFRCSECVLYAKTLSKTDASFNLKHMLFRQVSVSQNGEFGNCCLPGCGAV
jgi:hypothetical protein